MLQQEREGFFDELFLGDPAAGQLLMVFVRERHAVRGGRAFLNGYPEFIVGCFFNGDHDHLRGACMAPIAAPANKNCIK